MKKYIALALTLAMLLPVGLVPAAAAEETGHTFKPTVSPGVTETETTVDTGIPGMTLTLGADEWSCSDVDIDIVSAAGVPYNSFLVGKANPKTAEGKGTYFTFTFDDTVKVGSLEIMYRLNAGKAFYILDNGEAMEGYDGMKLDVAADTSTTIIVEGGHSYTVYASGSKLRLYGCTFKNVDPAQVFADEIAAFPFDRVKGVNADVEHVDEDLALVDSYESQFGSCDVSWTSSNPKVIDVDGTVNCQKTETTVTLTGHFSVQERREFAADVSFDVTVLADPDDASAVAVAKEALTLGDTSSVKRNLELPDSGKRGTSVTWKSSDDSIVGADGKVYPAAQKDQTATLTATITRGDAKETKDFTVTVAGIVPVTLDSWTYQDAEGNTRFTPVDGGALLAVAMTCNNPNPDPDDRVYITVYGPDGKEKAARDFAMAELFEGIPTGKSVTVAVSLEMDAGDHFELSAKNAKTGAELIKSVRNDDTLAEGAKLYVVGDSTASVYGDDRYPRKGWAQMLGGYFDGVEVVDLALSGRASMSFKNEANYTTLKNSLKKGDYLLIQFGHNDNKADAYTDPDGDRFTEGSFQQSMLEYVELAWEKGAKPIIATSISRRKLSDETLEKYVRSAQMLAESCAIPCIDLYAATNGWINQVGVDAAQDMFNCVKPHDSRFVDYAPFAGSEFYEKGSTDDTHLNIYGADLIAQWAADEMKELGIPVAAKMSGHRATYPLPAFAAATETAPGTAPGTTQSGVFNDVKESDWFYASVKRVSDSGIFNGTGEGRFSPDMVTTRAMVATLLYRLDGQSAAAGQSVQSPFSDVSADAWYAPAVAWASAPGVVTGYGNGAFGPDDPVTREQLAVMVYRYCTVRNIWSASDVNTLPFADADAVSAWAGEAMEWLAAKGILAGKPGNLADPTAPVTRAETAVVLDRLMTLMGK